MDGASTLTLPADGTTPRGTRPGSGIWRSTALDVQTGSVMWAQRTGTLLLASGALTVQSDTVVGRDGTGTFTICGT